MTTGRCAASASLSSVDDPELIRLFLAGEHAAFQQLVERYQPPILALVRRIVGDLDQAEDVVQETFIRAWSNLHRYREDGKFSSWLHRIAVNLAKSELRRRSRSRLVFYHTLPNACLGPRALDLQDPLGRPDQMFRQRQLRRTVDRAVRHLPDEQREIFVLREFDGMSYQEISRSLGLKMGTVKSRLNRARSEFVRLIEPVPAARIQVSSLVA